MIHAVRKNLVRLTPKCLNKNPRESALIIALASELRQVLFAEGLRNNYSSMCKAYCHVSFFAFCCILLVNDFLRVFIIDSHYSIQNEGKRIGNKTCAGDGGDKLRFYS